MESGTKKKHTIYCLSGLGADHRIFQQLQLPDATLHPIKWQVPHKGQPLASFAAQLAQQIVHPHPILLGVSFGGMLATEIANIIPVEKTIIVSSCKHRQELPLLLRAAGKLGLHKALPYWMATQSKLLNRLIFDVRSSEEELFLKRIMLQQTDKTFLKRAVHMILTWQTNNSHAKPIIHIHGKKDHLLTPSNIKADYWIPGGGHFMIWNEAAAISQIINELLEK